jgi:hypothetical protein
VLYGLGHAAIDYNSDQVLDYNLIVNRCNTDAIYAVHITIAAEIFKRKLLVQASVLGVFQHCRQFVCSTNCTYSTAAAPTQSSNQLHVQCGA